MNSKPKSLLAGIRYADGFDDEGRRLLAECDEFKLYELFHEGGEQELVYSPTVERALFKSLFRISESTERLSSEDERIEVARALLGVLRSAKADENLDSLAIGLTPGGTISPGGGVVGTRVVRTLGKLLLRAMKYGEPDDAANIVKTCVRAVFAHEGRLPDKRSRRAVPFEASLIWEAAGQFRHLRKAPTKAVLIERLRAIGFDHPGKDRTSKWRATFDRAGLGGLPEE